MATDADSAPQVAPDDARSTDEQALHALRNAELTVVGAMTDASNATLYTTLSLGGADVGAAIYKPVSGEQPLWDFTRHTLHKREVATYVLARFTGLDVVPPTILRRDAPFGPGSLQLWVGPRPGAAQPEPGAGVVDVCPLNKVPKGWRRIIRARDGNSSVALCHADDPRLQAMAVLDALANNADRKGGHIIDRGDGRLAGVDHGLTFNTEPKLRTVLWGWVGEPLPERCLQAVRAVRDDLACTGSLYADLAPLLADDELAALADRAESLLEAGCFPAPHGYGPAIPWPAF